MLYDDTIAAIATPPGEGGIGIIRLSGRGAMPILQAMFAPTRPGRWRSYQMRHGHVVAADGERVDEALAVFMRGPRSFTAEDVAEISCHGGPLVLARALGLALAHGARLAEPGEFTMRAFTNGRIDLTRAEATLDVIQAKTDAALRLAQAQLGGWLSAELAAIREELLAPLAYVTALIDFPEDEVEAHEVERPVRAALARLDALLATADQGVIYRQGARAALIGRPNAGKSSLLNALLRTERAIVTPIPGTTRDTLEETANVRGIPVVLVDTAGITETLDPVEQIGVGRSRAALASAELVLLVLDATADIGEDERQIAVLAEGKQAVVVLNKRDLLGGDAPSERVAQAQALLPAAPLVHISATTGEGLDALRDAVASQLLGGISLGEGRLITSPRHRDALGRAAQLLRDALRGHQRGISPDLLSIDLTAALAAIGEVTGEAVGDDLLAAIFSRFCIGK
ncbi:tRNA uridine-5-carboxymethylaminomethyl(34) synthesis GTPase MnmE [Chloroflexia bacterium SDU3-3]|nr:tRNA uridine-5-carboxymethylaminomethyl(34) synthesis GTPase MnmE [Chloroflexia bacterium SDU3-3]